VCEHEIAYWFGLASNDFTQSLVQYFVAKFPSDPIQRHLRRFRVETHFNDSLSPILEVNETAISKLMSNLQERRQTVNVQVDLHEKAISIFM